MQWILNCIFVETKGAELIEYKSLDKTMAPWGTINFNKKLFVENK